MCSMIQGAAVRQWPAGLHKAAAKPQAGYLAVLAAAAGMARAAAVCTGMPQLVWIRTRVQGICRQAVRSGRLRAGLSQRGAVHEIAWLSCDRVCHAAQAPAVRQRAGW